jgi:hypothetical protein
MTFDGVQPCPPICMFLRHHRAPQYAQKVGLSRLGHDIYLYWYRSVETFDARGSISGSTNMAPSRELGISAMEGS